ncbi:MAG: cation-transporting P-type ATPase [Acidobacteria bacterium]|nr:cation-transporting P-type ATPase [Acidobacteriota bacterium]
MRISSPALVPPFTPSLTPAGAPGAPDARQLLDIARADVETVLKELGSRLDGLSPADAESRVTQFGTNEIAREQRMSAVMRLLSNIKNPLVLLLLALGVLSFLTGDLRATVVIVVMVVLGVVLRFFQEMRADNAAAALKAMVSNTATIVRGGKDEEAPLKTLVPGDIVRLAAGDIVIELDRAKAPITVENFAGMSVLSFVPPAGWSDSELYIGTSSGFTPGASNLYERCRTSRFIVRKAAGTYYARIVIRDQYGNQSRPSAPWTIDPT